MKKILVIEDEIPVKENILELLKEEGYLSIGADNGVEGVRLAWEHLPDLIICDILMPRMDGYSVLAVLSRDRQTALIPFIFLTARTGREDQRMGMELGADDYVTKPFTRQELLTAINVRLDKQARVADQVLKKQVGLHDHLMQALPHELMSPLSLILGFSTALTDPDQTIARDQVSRLATDIHTSASHLLRLIQNYLLYAELEVIRSNPQRLEAYLRDIQPCDTQSLCELAGLVADQENRLVDFACDIEPAILAVSEDSLHKIAEELLIHAFKDTSPGCHVSLVGGVSGSDSYALAVVDEGQGMATQQVAEFESPIQYDERLHENQEGNLGLLLVKRLAELNRGQFSLESQPGEGTKVKVTLPLGKIPV